jgi:pimeloyl-ACP methyl ester carboxylesterase
MIASLFGPQGEATQAPQQIGFQTSDGVRIASEFYSEPSIRSSTLLVVAPGFAQAKDSQVMKSLCQSLFETKSTDVLCLDFRGTGGSSGTYSFGVDEPLDLQPVLEWGHENYKRVEVLGLSMGAYIAVRAAAFWPNQISKLLLVSCPPDFIDVISSGGVLGEIIHFVLNPVNPETQTGANWLFHWGNPFAAEPNLVDLVPQIEVPSAFLVGQEDPLVQLELTRPIFNSIAGSKSWTEFPQGDHAEAMFVQDPIAFIEWVKSSLSVTR